MKNDDHDLNAIYDISLSYEQIDEVAKSSLAITVSQADRHNIIAKKQPSKG